MNRLLDRLAALLKALSAASLGCMMLLTCADVVARAAGRPFLGAVEGAGLLATLALALSLPYAHRERAHVGVEVLTMRLGRRARAGTEAATGVLAAGLFAVVAWRSGDYAAQMRASGEVSMTLQLPTYWIIYAIAASFAVLALVQFADVAGALRRLGAGAGEEGG